MLSSSCCPLEQLPGHRIGQREMAGDGRQPLPLCWEPAEPSPAHHSCTISEPRWILSPPRTAGSPDILMELLQGLPSAELIFQTDPKHRSLCQKHIRAARQERRCRGASGCVTGGLAARSPLRALIPHMGMVWHNLTLRDGEMHPRGIQGCVIPPSSPFHGGRLRDGHRLWLLAELPVLSSLPAPRGCFHPQDPPATGSGASAPPGVVPPHLHHDRRASGCAQSMRMAWKSHGSAKAGR